MAMNMRLFSFLEYLRDFDNDPAPFAANQQIVAYLHELMETAPNILLGDR